jgi:nicotinate-nucleotide adenylyltransferase
MSEALSRIGILGGTFNPIHYGHLIIAEAVRESFGMDKVLFVPSGMPPHKSNIELSGAEHRYGMVECAIRSNPYFEASRIELDRSGYTYTVDTLISLKSRYGDNTTLYFMIGADVINELTTWKDFKNVFSLSSFIAVNRPGYDAKTVENDIERLVSQYGASIKMLEAPMIDISSSGIRERVYERRSIKYLVPGCVEDYIYKNGLYM